VNVKRKVSIIVPAFNEQATIAESVRRLLEVDFGDVETEVLIVDDASTDQTAEIASHLGGHVRLICQESNHGKGAAIRRALKEATGSVVVIHDADLEYVAADIPTLVEPILSGQTNAVFGNRFANTKLPPGMQFKNLVANRILAITANVLFGGRLADEATCYKAVRTDVLRGMNLRCERFEFCPEVTAKLLRSGEKILEVPVHYHARTVAEGKKIHWYDGLEAIWTLLKYRFIR
jgi:glycosyltransferase involved in cell wall biosynthesis